MPLSRWLHTVATEIRFAGRLLTRSPVFAVTSAASLAIGLAAATTIFGVGDALLLRASPGVRGADRIVDIARTSGGSSFDTMSYPMFRHLRDHTRTLDLMAATTLAPEPMSLSDGSTSERVFARTVSNTFFEVLGVRPALGRFFSADEDDVPEARPVVVLSHRFWRTRFDGDPSVVERTVLLNRTAFTIIGVAEAGFDDASLIGSDVWVPMAMAGTVRGRPGRDLLGDPAVVWHMAVGRLAPGVQIEAARSELNALLQGFQAETPSLPADYAIRVEPTGPIPAPVRTPARAFLGLLFALTVGLLAIACSNLAGMLLARASARRHEMAARLALGASRGRLIRQMLIETIVLFALAVAVALPLTVWLASALLAFLPTLPMPIHVDAGLTLRGAVFAATTAFVAAVVFGLAPARHALAADVAPLLNARSSSGPGRTRLRDALVVAQVGVSLATGITAGLMIRSLDAAARIDPGFRTADVTVVSLDTSVVGADGEVAAALTHRIVDRVRTIGGVRAVGHGRVIPLQGESFGIGRARVPGLSDAALDSLRGTSWDVVSPDYFVAIGMPILAGRAFDADDRAGRPDVAVVNESFAAIAWPGESPVGRRFRLHQGPEDDAGRPVEVVGLVADAKYRYLTDAARPFAYVPYAQHPQTRVELFVSHAPGRALANEVRAAVHAVEPGMPVVTIQAFDDAAALGLLPQRLAAWVTGAAGAVGLFLAALGVYGLAAFLVGMRRREFAIRIALGATRRRVLTMVVGRAAGLGLAGAVAGMAMAVGIGWLIEQQGLLVGVPAVDPVTYIALVACVSVVVLVASAVPARRAASADPAGALRAE